MFAATILITILSSFIPSFLSIDIESHNQFAVPNIVHQIYDYKAPNFFMFLSIMCVQRYLKPEKHYFWVNDAGRFRRGEWEHWQANAKPNSWEANFTSLIKSGAIVPMFRSFSQNPPGNSSVFALNKAHMSDFVRLSVLKEYGGIYLDTDAFPIHSLDSVRVHEFTMSFDNIVNPEKHAPKRLCNGVFLSSPNSQYLLKWTEAYANFNPQSWDEQSSIVPYQLATEYPDLIQVEWSRLSPVSYGFQTADAASALTCGIFDAKSAAVLIPNWDKGYSYNNVVPNKKFFHAMNRKLVLHLTMTAVRGVCMMRKNLYGPEVLQSMPSLLGHYFRIALYGEDNFDYESILTASADVKLASWQNCRQSLGMFSPPDPSAGRQQYMSE